MSIVDELLEEGIELSIGQKTMLNYLEEKYVLIPKAEARAVYEQLMNEWLNRDQYTLLTSAMKRLGKE